MDLIRNRKRERERKMGEIKKKLVITKIYLYLF